MDTVQVDAPDLLLSVETLPPQIVAPGVSSPPRIHCDAEQTRLLEAHVSAHPGVEAGGILLGKAEVTAGEVHLTVLASLQAEAVDAGPGHLRFTMETWRLLEVRRATLHRNALVLGWYHSHPGLGLFLSEPDRELHRLIFGHEPWSVALVIDPKSRTRAYFWYHAGVVVKCAETAEPEDVSARGTGGLD